jgi:hypothetical protein
MTRISSTVLGQAFGLGALLITLTLVVSAAYVGPASSAPRPDLRAEALAHLIQRSGQSCILSRESLHQSLADDAEAQAGLQKLGAEPGWARDGVAYAGPAEAAAAAYGGLTVVSSESEIWLLEDRGDLVALRQLVRTGDSAAGPVWVRGSMLIAVADAECT